MTDRILKTDLKEFGEEFQYIVIIARMCKKFNNMMQTHATFHRFDNSDHKNQIISRICHTYGCTPDEILNEHFSAIAFNDALHICLAHKHQRKPLSEMFGTAFCETLDEIKNITAAFVGKYLVNALACIMTNMCTKTYHDYRFPVPKHINNDDLCKMINFMHKYDYMHMARLECIPENILVKIDFNAMMACLDAQDALDGKKEFSDSSLNGLKYFNSKCVRNRLRENIDKIKFTRACDEVSLEIFMRYANAKHVYAINSGCAKFVF